jgi:hypothetical protein
MFRRLLPRLLALALVVLIHGCSKTTATLSGKVTLNGEELSTGEVAAYKDKEMIASSRILDGTYQLGNLPEGPITLVVRTHLPDGTPLGIDKPVFPPDLPAQARKDMEKALPDSVREALQKVKPVPLKYTNVNESDLQINVGDNSTYNIEMTGKGELPKPPDPRRGKG